MLRQYLTPTLTGGHVYFGSQSAGGWWALGGWHIRGVGQGRNSSSVAVGSREGPREEEVHRPFQATPRDPSLLTRLHLANHVQL